MELKQVHKNIAFTCLLVKNQRNIEKNIKNQHVTRPIIDPIKQTSEHAFLARLSLEYRFFKNKRNPVVF